MSEPTVAPCGSWRSPITSDLIVSGSVNLGNCAVDEQDIYWLEGRPAEGGRSVLVRRTPDGRRSDVTPSPFNVRTRVHEYGGGAYTVQDRHAFFSHFGDGQLYHQSPGEAPRPLTNVDGLRYADMVVDKARDRLICVREDHTGFEGEVVNTLVSVRLSGDEGGTVLIAGNDFYASPRVSPDGRKLAWLTWNHPYMPWDGTELWTGDIAPDGSIQQAVRVAGAIGTESIFQPEFSPDGTLYFVSDRNGWWNLYRWVAGEVEPLVEMNAEFGVPQWVFGLSTYAFVAQNRILCTYITDGQWQLANIDMATRTLTPIASPWTYIADIVAGPGFAVFRGGSATLPNRVIRIGADNVSTVLRTSTEISLDDGYLSIPQSIEFPTTGNRTAFAFFYPPNNKDYLAPGGERPPLITISHGGPTSATASLFSLSIQYWTSRGFAVIDVNYGGSTGYGRAYRERLNGTWGVVDVDDCVHGARWLVDQRLVDGRRLAIRGGSAGGYTTLAALTFRDAFQVGASYFGISDIALLASDTHKFESRYMERLVGPWPDSKDLFYARSPIHFADQLSCPVIFFQGLDDKVVPPNQAEDMVDKLRSKGVPVAYLTFEGEGHGFRKADNIKRTLDGELYFYSKIFGFALTDAVEPVAIYNLDGRGD